MTIALMCPPGLDHAAEAIGREAIAALEIELALYPKPGLVSPIDTGAHDDMDAATFARSIGALRSYFPAIAAAAARDRPFEDLRALGVAAERRMLAATGGINTHRGAIFCLGLLAAAAGWGWAQGLALDGPTLARIVRDRWSVGIRAAASEAAESHGTRAVRRYGARGARDEALAGFPTVFATALPTLQATLEATGCREQASIQCLFAVMAELEDTNLLHRGGAEGLAFVQAAARDFLAAGGVGDPAWRRRALALHGDCVALHLSPGGAADCLAAAWFAHRISTAIAN